MTYKTRVTIHMLPVIGASGVMQHALNAVMLASENSVVMDSVIQPANSNEKRNTILQQIKAYHLLKKKRLQGC